jgi:FkbM family methyltransferase
MVALLRSDSDTLDAGAHAGDFLEHIVRLAPRGQHIAYEPLLSFHAELVQRFPEVDVRRAALSDHYGQAAFFHFTKVPGFSGLAHRNDIPGDVEEINVRLEPLDDAVPESFAPAFMKVDVEGAELQALRGAQKTIRRHRPVILFEHDSGAAELNGSNSAELWELLDDTGLRVFDLDGGGPYSRRRFEAAFSEPIWNYLAVPGDSSKPARRSARPTAASRDLRSPPR